MQRWFTRHEQTGLCWFRCGHVCLIEILSLLNPHLLRFDTFCKTVRRYTTEADQLSLVTELEERIDNLAAQTQIEFTLWVLSTKCAENFKRNRDKGPWWSAKVHCWTLSQFWGLSLRSRITCVLFYPPKTAYYQTKRSHMALMKWLPRINCCPWAPWHLLVPCILPEVRVQSQLQYSSSEQLIKTRESLTSVNLW
jgi:hypothetical protein